MIGDILNNFLNTSVPAAMEYMKAYKLFHIAQDRVSIYGSIKLFTKQYKLKYNNCKLAPLPTPNHYSIHRESNSIHNNTPHNSHSTSKQPNKITSNH